jgi:GTP-binding protein
MEFLSFARFHFISALRGSGITEVLKSVDEAYAPPWPSCRRRV